jgi:pimeloyl-ACP methyl ester carboxylesterase
MLRALAGGELFGEAWGTEPAAVIALHGWRRTHTDFNMVLGPAASRGPLPSIAPDLPGFGATPAPAEAWGSEQYADAVARMIEGSEGGSSPRVVLGHSLGGRVAVRLAAEHPDLVKALVLTGAPLVSRQRSQSRPPFAFRAVRALHRLGLVGDERMELARRTHGSVDYRASDGVMREVLVRLVNESYEDSLVVIGCPVELVWGEKDTEVPLAVAESIGERVEQAVLTVCPGVGHLTPLECPEELRSAVERALGVS